MSYILDALKKSDAERKRGDVPTLNSVSENAHHDQPAPRKPLPLIIAGTFAVLAVVGFTVNLAMKDNPQQQHVTAKTMVKPNVPTSSTVDTNSAAVVEVTKPAEQKTGLASEPEIAPSTETTANPKTKQITDTKTKPVVKVAKVVAPKPVVKPVVKPVAKPVAKPVIKPEPRPVVDPIVKPKPKPFKIYSPKPKPKIGLPPLTNAVAYVNRAWESIDKGLYTQAIYDLDQALVSEPSYGDAWFAKGWANEKNGHEQKAIKDYDRAIEADPNNAFALFSRGFLKLYNKDAQGAAIDFVRSQGVAKEESFKTYSRLWLYISRLRTGQSKQASHKNLLATKSSIWPSPVVHYVLGKIDENQLLKIIKGGDLSGFQERQVTGYFFLGLIQKQLGDFSNAQRYFEMALASGGIQFRQYDAARREVEILNQRNNKPANTPNG